MLFIQFYEYYDIKRVYSYVVFTDEVLKSASQGHEDEEGQGRGHSAHEHDKIVLKYKELIREQVSSFYM